MLRFTLLPIIALITSIVLGIISFFLYRKIKRGIEYTVKKGAKLASDQQQKWAESEQKKKLPEIIQKAFDDFDKLTALQKKLAPEWKTALTPLISQAKEILDEVAFDELENESQQGKKLNSVRSFFHHSLDALVQFCEKLSKDYSHMNNEQIEQARQNLTLFKADLNSHQKTLEKSRKLDFDVLMEVIKARLKK